MMKIESKEKLAKLLATEDLDVQHQQVDTAYFDVKSRTLILPTWKDMPNHLYDLLVGHEVGHALFTPTNTDRLQKAYQKTSKACVNILEDARIEKLVKKRYPGLRKQFFSGYQHLVEKDFFGLSKRPMSGLNILDKINLYFKIPTAVDITFNEIEQVFVDRIEAANSFKDIEAIAKELYAYAKAEKDKEEQMGDDDENSQPQYSDEQSDGDAQDSSEAEADDSENGEGDDEGDVDIDETEKAEGEGDESPVDEEQDAFDNYMNDADNNEKNEDQEVPEPEQSEYAQDEVRSTTFEHFQERMDDLVNNEVKNYYLTIPDKANMKDAIVDYKDVHKRIDNFYGSMEANPNLWQGGWDDERFNALKKYVYDNGRATLSKFKKGSVKTVNHIAMEFERKKAADVYKKTSMSKTGILDTNKLFSAKYNDDVFKKNMRIPEGKNHGLVMILDWSGSMADNIYGCIKQVMELSFFCKKVNIPFEVYSFMEADPNQQMADGSYKNNPVSFKYKNNDLVTDCRVRLQNYLSSRMNAKDYNNGLLNMCILANRFQNRRGMSYDKFSYYACPKEDELHCTPLNGAILLSEHVIRKFKKDNNLQSVHAVFLTDGESSGSVYQYDITKDSENERRSGRSKMYDEKCNIYLKDTITKKNHLIMKGGFYGRGTAITPTLLDVVRGRLGINIVGFFILNSFSNSALWRFVPKQKHVTYEAGQVFYKDWVKKAKKDGWFIKEQSGYNEYYVIKGDTLKNEIINDLNVKPDMTAHRMAQMFMKKNNAFKTNRVILSRFIDLITENTTA